MKTAKIGDKIHAMGITVTISEILYQEYWFDHWTGKESWDIELKDENGYYRHWKSELDGGELIPC